MSLPRDHYRKIPLSAKRWQELRRHAGDYNVTRTRLCAQIILDWLESPRRLSVVLDEARPHAQKGKKRESPKGFTIAGLDEPIALDTMEGMEARRRAEREYQRLVDGKIF